MNTTTWKLALKDAGASRTAQRITAALSPMLAALREVTVAAPAAQSAIASLGSGGAAAQIRGVTTALREQTRALREQQGVAGRASVTGGARRGGAAAASPASPSGRVVLGPQFQQRAQAFQYAARVRDTQRSRTQEIRADQNYFQRLSRLTQQSFAENRRLAARERTVMARQQVAARANFTRARATSRATFGEMLGTLGSIGTTVLSAVLGVATAFGGVGLAAGAAAVQIASFRESSIASLGAVSNDAKSAERQFNRALAIANQTPLDSPDAINAQVAFRTAGFSERDASPLLAAFTDISAHGGNEAGQAFTRVVSQIHGLGRVNRGDIQQQALTAGLSPQAIYDSIARQMHLGEGAAGRRAAEARVGHRGVNDTVGIQAFLDATRQALDNGGQSALGTYAQGQSRTLTGALSNLVNAPFSLIAQINTAKTPGAIAFREAILAVTTALDASTPSGRAFLGIITSVTNTVGGLFARITPESINAGLGLIAATFARVQRFGVAALPIARAFISGVGPGLQIALVPLRALFASLVSGGGPSAATLALLASAARGLGFVLGAVVSAIALTSVVLTTFFGTISTVVLGGIGLIANIGASLFTGFQSVGGNIVNGIIAGIRGAAGTLVTEVGSLGHIAVTALRSALGIHSPSRVFADMVGAHIPSGIAMGINANAGAANDAVAGIVNPRVPQLGAGGASLHLEINVTGARDATETARTVRSEVEDVLGSIFGQWAEAVP